MLVRHPLPALFRVVITVLIKKHVCKVMTLILPVLLAACSSTLKETPFQQAKQIAEQGALISLPVTTHLPIMAWGRLAPSPVTHVYIEGDGHAWRNSHLPSMDPTPHDPVGLKLAAADHHPSVLYLGRPCQYQVDTARSCHFSVWTKRRFTETADIKVALQQSVPSDHELILIGFSGGANIAIQLAAELPMVSGIITVAGNLDSASFNRFHRTAYEQYGDNGQRLQQLAHLPQLHYTGSKDPIIPPTLTRLQLTDVELSHCVQVNVVPNATHHGPWSIDWQTFLALQKACRAK